LENGIKKIFAAAAPAVVAALTEVIQYARLIVPGKSWLDKESRRLNACALKAADRPCTPQDAEKIIHYAFGERWPDFELIDRYVKKMLNQDPKSPLFLYFQYLHGKRSHLLQRPPTEKDLQRLRDIQALAVERNERLLINLLGKEIRQIEEFLSSSFEDDDDDDPEDDEEDDDNRKAADLEKFSEELAEAMDRIFKPHGKSSSRRKKKRAATSQASLFDDSDIPF
jgi:anaerobic selenocysteine-containing dehydrogenase